MLNFQLIKLNNRFHKKFSAGFQFSAKISQPSRRIELIDSIFCAFELRNNSKNLCPFKFVISNIFPQNRPEFFSAFEEVT